MIQLNQITLLLKNIVLTSNGDKVVQFSYAHNSKTPDLCVHLVQNKIDPLLTGNTSFSKNTRDFLKTTGLNYFIKLEAIYDKNFFSLDFKKKFENDKGLALLYTYMKLSDLMYLFDENIRAKGII